MSVPSEKDGVSLPYGRSRGRRCRRLTIKFPIILAQESRHAFDMGPDGPGVGLVGVDRLVKGM